MKKSINFLGALTIAVALIAGFTACTNEDNILEEQQPAVQAPVFHVSIPASFDSDDAQTRGVEFSGESTISSIFKTTENVYVYNETKQVLACDNTGNPIALHPSAISADGKRCTLTGDLTFYHYDSEWIAVTPEEGDTYSLFYQMTDPNSEQPQWSNFVYENQSGTAASASAHDFAKATGVTLTLSGGNTLTVDNVNFQLMQSMFRQHLVFVDENGDAISPAPVISSLKIESKNSALVKFIKPSDNVIGHDPIKINDFSGSDLYLALTFAYDVDHPAEGDKLSVIVTDEDGKKYYCSKNAPQNGFANGKYYHGTMTLKYAPVVRTDNGYEPVVKNAQGKYILEDGGEYTVQGTVNGSIEGSGSISLNIEEESVINGCVNLRSIYDKTWKDVNINTSYYGTVTINNPGQVALQAASDLPTNISIGTTLIVNGSVSGNCNLDGYGCIMQVEENLVDGSYYLADGCFLNVKGDLGNVTITASFNSSGTQNAEITNEYYPYSGYKVFYGGESSFIPEPEPEPEPETEP